MGFLDLVKLRKSVRTYKKGQDVDEGSINKILEAARVAPSAKNLQEWKFVIVKDKSVISKFVPVCKDQKFVGDAAALIVGCADETNYTMTCGQPAYTVDLAIALTHMSLMATELGIGSCWLGAFYEDQAKALLNIPANVRVVGILSLGYPTQDLAQIVTTNRKELKDIYCYEKWSF